MKRNFDFVLDNCKEDALDFVYEQTSNLKDDSGIIDTYDIMCLRDDLNSIIKVCEAIEDAKTIKQLKNILLKRYSKTEVNRLIPKA